LGRGVIIARPIDLDEKSKESTAFGMKKLILYEYWSHDNEFGLAIEYFNVFKRRNTDSVLVTQGLDCLDAKKIAYKPFPMKMIISRMLQHLRKPKNKAKRRALSKMIGELPSLNVHALIKYGIQLGVHRYDWGSEERLKDVFQDKLKVAFDYFEDHIE